MKENSIEEALKKLSTVKKIKIYELLRTFKREGIEDFVTTRKKYIDVILSDYKKVLQVNEKYKEFFDLMLRLDSDYFMNCGDEETNKLVDEILKLESE